MSVRIGEPAPAFTLQAYRRCEQDPVTATLEDFRRRRAPSASTRSPDSNS